VRTVFLGTPAAAVPSLIALKTSTDVVGVFTQPDRPRGRRGTPQPSHVKVAAGDHGLPVFQPERSAGIGPQLSSLGPIDVAVIVAFGMLIPPDALAVPAEGFVNVHFSLLPRWRGAAPVQRAMLAGDERTGVTLMRLDEGLDTGPLLVSVSSRIGRDETAGDLTGRLAGMGGVLLRRHILAIAGGAITAVPQSAQGTTHAPKLERSDRTFMADVDGETMRRTIMAMAPAPGLTADLDGQPVKFLRAGEIRQESGLAPGTLDYVDGALWCAASDAWVEIREIQSAGRRSMSGTDWARGRARPYGRLQ
jgi:methionyl-tRNA formyltransferase